MLQELGHAVGLGGTVHERYEDRAFMDRLKDTMKVADADTAAYDAIYMTGGHGVCFDFPQSEALAKLTAPVLRGRQGRVRRLPRPRRAAGGEVSAAST